MTTSKPLCFIDTETTSLNPDRQVWEVAMILDTTEGHSMDFSFFVNVDVSTADPNSLRIGKFYERHPSFTEDMDIRHEQEAISEQQAAEYVETWTRGAVLVASNPGFDTEALSKMLRRHGLIESWYYHPVDIKSMALGWLFYHGVEMDPWARSDDLCAAVAEILERTITTDPEMRHTAMGDTRWVREWYYAMMTNGSGE